MKSFLLMLFVCISLQLFAQDEGICFQDDSTLEQMLANSKASGKLVFVDCYTVWCGPCKWLAKEVFPLKEVGDFYNEHFISYKMDMETPEGEMMREKYQVIAYPTLLFLNSNGEKVHQGRGSLQAEDLIQLGEWALDTTTNYMAIKKKIENNTRDLETVITYLDINVKAVNKDTLLNDCFLQLSHDDKYSDAYWYLFTIHVNEIESPLFKYFITNRKEYEEKRGGEDVKNKLTEVFRFNIDKYEEDIDKLNQLKSIDSDLYSEVIQRRIFESAYNNFMNKDSLSQKVWTEFILLVQDCMKVFEIDPAYLNNISWNIYENYKMFNDTESLKLARVWSYNACSEFPESPYFNGTYGHVIYELGNKKEGIKHLELALKYAKEKEPDLVSYYQEELEKFKENKD